MNAYTPRLLGTPATPTIMATGTVKIASTILSTRRSSRSETTPKRSQVSRVLNLVLVTTFLVLSVFPSTCQAAGLVQRQRDIRVGIGRSVYLARDDLVISTVRRDESCRVEVVMNDPATQRVGKMHPPIFDCDFLPNTVEYIHTGSPLLKHDVVRLLVHKFTDSRTITQPVTLRVHVSNTSHEIFVTSGGRPLVVPKFNGVSNTLDSTALRFRSSDNQNVSCVVGFSTFFSPWPIAGQMVMVDSASGSGKIDGNGHMRNKQVVNSVKKDCREFLFMNLHYEHLRSPTPDVDYLPLSVELYDPALSEEVISERLYLPIHIKNAFQNAPPQASFLNMYMMDVDQFVLSTIVPGVISAEDYETRSRELVFNISRPFGDGQGFLVHLDNHAKPIFSFMQDDLDNHRIAYRPPSVSYPDQRVYGAEFVVSDSHFAQSMPITLHVAVRPSDTTAPRVAINTGLTLLEGQSREITADHFQVVDKDNPGRVKMYVKGGLQHGTLTVRGRHVVIFSMKDVEAGHVVYHHDDSDTTRDRIELRISDGSNTVLSSFPITIIPRDDTPPYLVNNLGLQINEGGTRRITDEMLLSQDADSLDGNIIYSILRSPRAGDIIRRIRPSDSGTKVFGFRQRDVLKGQIYYRHHGDEVFKDMFAFTVKDHQEPPNESEVMQFEVIITPMNENPPRIDPSSKRIMYLKETEIGYIQPSELRYTDIESPNSEILFTITTPPYFVYNRGERDAGRLVKAHNISSLNKDTDVSTASKFTQADIDHLKVAYIPPKADIGPESRLVRMAFTVEDGSGNKLYGQTFDIEVNPVNNHAPVFVTSKLLVEEGGVLGITTNQLSATDIDTPPALLKFALIKAPKYGTLQNDGRTLKEKQYFVIEDLQKKRIRYLQDGTDVERDTFTLKLMDGTNDATKEMSVEIVPIDDQTPTLSKNLRPQLIVSEGEQASISTRILAATDEDTNDESLVFLIVRQPRYGVLQLRGQPATKFSQQDVKAGRVSFLHTSGETGTNTLKDYATFIISDQNYRATADMPVYDLNITITPVNNQKPTVLIGSPVFVAEGESFRFSDEVLKVSDPDSKTKEIQFMVTRQPQWGFIENTKPAPGSEKDNSGIRVNSFTFGDILDGSVNYVQAKHRGVEPIKDELEIYATDGKLNSDIRIIRITIVPANDEVPDLMLSDFSVVEGGSMDINPTLLDVIDMDVPRDQLKLSISKPPEHGEMSLKVRTRRGLVKSPVQTLTVDELHNGAQLVYTHDGTEVFTDSFTVSVSDGKHDLKKVCNISIKLHNDERPEVVKNAGLSLEYGDHALVSSLVLQSKDDDRDDRDLYYILVEVPEKGFLQYCPDPLAPAIEITCTDLELGENFTQTDVDQNRIRYIHTHSMGNTETDRFVFVLTDGTHKRHEETFEIHVRNSRKANIAVLNKGMVVKEGERVAISTASLSASDESTRAEEIVFAVTRAPRLGQIENIKRQFVPISSFTQMDLASQRVVYHHLTKNDITADSFTFTVTNGLSEARDGLFRISIQPMDRILPSLIANNLLEVLLGTVKPLTPLLLKATDPDTAAHNVTFRVEKPPVQGHLYNRGVLVKDTFTQNDVDLGFVTYESVGSEPGLDNFLFTVSDGRHEGFLVNGTMQTQPAMMSIFVQPLIEDAPRLMINKSPELLQHLGRQRYGYKLTNANLRAVDSDSDSGNLYYILTSRPKRGHLENIKAKRYVRRRFTQKDLDDESLLYIVDSKADSYADTFSFRIEDSRGNVLRDQHFQMSWSKVQFDRDEVVLCENIGTLNIAITRTGNLDQSSYVGVHIRGMSAKKGEDYIPKSSKQVQFDPGESRATWQLSIPDDGLEEPNEKLRLSLVDPVNTILGDTRKLRLLIINAQRGECPQYLGMISKHNPVDNLLTDHASEIPTGQNADLLRQYHQLSGVPRDPGLDNTYLNTEAEKKTIGLGSPSATGEQTTSSSSSSSSSSRKNKRKRGKGKKRRRRRKGKKKRRTNKRKNRKSRKDSPDTGGFDMTSPSYPDSARTTGISYQVPRRCTTVTKGLLHYDDFNLQLLKCDGRAWQPWAPNSGSDDAGGAGPSCQQGWYEYEGRCYKPVNERLSWDESEDKCIKMYNGHLTSLRSMRQLRWLAQKMERRAFWIGLNDKAVSGRWQYSNGEPVAFFNWRNGTPRIRRNGHKKNCVMVRKRFKFRNKHCDKYLARYVCEALPTRHVESPKMAASSRKQRRGSRRHSRRQRANYGYFVDS